MSERTEASIDIDATPEQVLDVVADVASYPKWANGISSAEVLEAGPGGRPVQARFRLDAGPVRDEYVLRYSWEPTSVNWDLVSADVLSAMDGSYVVTQTGTGSRVEYRLTVDLKMPMLGLLKRKAERAVVDTALKDLKRRVEGQG